MMIIITLVSNNVPTTAPLITATLTESSSLLLVDTLDTIVPITTLFHVIYNVLDIYSIVQSITNVAILLALQAEY